MAENESNEEPKESSSNSELKEEHEKKESDVTLSRDKPQTLEADDRKTSKSAAECGTKKLAKDIEEEKKPKEYSDDPEQQKIVDFLRSKDISENLIGRVLKNGLPDGFDRLLRGLGITNAEMERFQWKEKFDPNDRAFFSLEESQTDFIDSEDSAMMSPDNLYLKKHFGCILVRAMKDIVKRKPFDPVDFLGKWLINYKVREERENKRKEFEAELMAHRKLSKAPDLEPDIIDHDEGEESPGNDWNFVEYEGPEML